MLVVRDARRLELAGVKVPRKSGGLPDCVLEISQRRVLDDDDASSFLRGVKARAKKDRFGYQEELAGMKREWLVFRAGSFQVCFGPLFIEGRGGRSFEAFEDGQMRTSQLDQLAGMIAADEGMLKTMCGLEASVRGEIRDRLTRPGAAPLEGMLQFLVLAEEVRRKG